jgi:hypothetical protein
MYDEDTKAYDIRTDFSWLEYILVIHDFDAYFHTYGTI